VEKVIVAFENEKHGARIQEILESSGTASCIGCRSADQVKRLVHKQRLNTVVCGFKLVDDVAENLFHDLPDHCSMLLIANQEQLEMINAEDIFKLPIPVGRGDLTASVRMLIQFGHRLEKFVRPQRSDEEEALIHQAKELLIHRNGMTEEEAHRFLQKRSMDTGARMVQTAQLILQEP
jgi:response regulator NasT